MPRLALLDHAGTGSQAEYLEDKTLHQTHLAGPSRLRQSLRTPLFVAIVVSGLTFAFGEGGSKRVLAGVLFGVGMAIAAVNFMAWLFP